jgi:hypothetical protein
MSRNDDEDDDGEDDDDEDRETRRSAKNRRSNGRHATTLSAEMNEDGTTERDESSDNGDNDRDGGDDDDDRDDRDNDPIPTQLKVSPFLGISISLIILFYLETASYSHRWPRRLSNGPASAYRSKIT